MDDREIVELYFERSEDAISETDKKYGRYCKSIAENILHSAESAEECVSDAYMSAWSSIPPTRPWRLRAYLARLTRNNALNRYARERAQKRNAGVEAVLDEIEELIAAPDGDPVDLIAIRDGLNEFLASLPRRTRIIFVKRYWYLASIREIADEIGVSETSVKVSLYRTRGDLKQFLEKKGITI